METPRVDSLQGAVSVYGYYMDRRVVLVEGLPLLGHIAFGIIDRGTNILQVRPSTLCFHNCIFCSVDAGSTSRWRATEFLVSPSLLAEWAERVASVKGHGLEALIDGVGEPLTHPRILDIIKMLRSIDRISSIALETHGGSLSKSLARSLEKAGLDRINLSIDAVTPRLAKSLVGVEWYDPLRVLSIAEWILENTSMDVVLTPVVVPGYNEDEMERLVEWARKVGAGRKSGWPTGVLIQKYELHRYGRRPPRVSRVWSWKRFYAWLKSLEEKTNYKLLATPSELGFQKRRSVDKPFKIGDTVRALVVGRGWHRGEVLAVDHRWRRVIAVFGLKPGLASQGREIVVRIERDKDNIFIGRPD